MRIQISAHKRKEKGMPIPVLSPGDLELIDFNIRSTSTVNRRKVECPFALEPTKGLLGVRSESAKQLVLG